MSIKLSENITVSPQIPVGQIQSISDQGYDVLMCNRPDHEEPGQPSVEAMREAAIQSGMRFVHIPIVSGQFTGEAVEAFRDELETGDNIFAYCRTGTRCAGLWALSQAGRMSADDILQKTQQAGYDFSGMRSYLEKSSL